MSNQDIIVHFDVVADFWTHGREAYQASLGDYDEGSKVGTGHTPLNAIVDLLDQLEG